MIRLIVNADDFGLHEEVNKGIVHGHKEGIITSTSLLANGYDFDGAVAAAKNLPELGIGIHTALVGGLPPLSEPHKVPSLLENGKFVESYPAFLKKAATGQINFQEVYHELNLQFEKIMSSGLNITHVDGHQHLHVLPQITPIMVTLLKKYGIKKMRIPAEDKFFRNGITQWGRFAGKVGLAEVADHAYTFTSRHGIWSPRYFWGMMSGGHLNEERLLEILGRVAKTRGSHEIMTHPGAKDSVLEKEFNWGYHWESELYSMCSPVVKEFIRAHEIRLLNYGECE
ncbi:ChbG/HpnK family deacetylase [uncultured Veillonella sp.]|uniref:ChbG/HpnK family deacetylase n=1 Tax=uncultured Veillonella sp. TaxID=159268 RepID=UPI0025F4B8B2|nr:ChbG/HpnK family deacetylase [uncultured Veillonella sp.]MDY3974596.1 ChbG/HpnK family deacetylase [Veillonella caviae]